VAVLGEAATSFIAGGLSDPGRRIGTVIVQGHFDDEGARHCVRTGIGVSLGVNPNPGEPGAILFCRQAFVATEVLRP
jgi:hypothetical protein